MKSLHTYYDESEYEFYDEDGYEHSYDPIFNRDWFRGWS